MRKGKDFLIRSLTQTVRKDIHHSVMVHHENKVVCGMILRFSRWLKRRDSGLSAVEWSPFWPIQSTRIQLMPGPSSSYAFCRKKRAFSHL